MTSSVAKKNKKIRSSCVGDGQGKEGKRLSAVLVLFWFRICKTDSSGEKPIPGCCAHIHHSIVISFDAIVRSGRSVWLPPHLFLGPAHRSRWSILGFFFLFSDLINEKVKRRISSNVSSRAYNYTSTVYILFIFCFLFFFWETDAVRGQRAWLDESQLITRIVALLMLPIRNNVDNVARSPCYCWCFM